MAWTIEGLPSSLAWRWVIAGPERLPRKGRRIGILRMDRGGVPTQSAWGTEDDPLQSLFSPPTA